MRFNVGDTVFRANFTPLTEKWITCPDCCGNRKLKVTLGTGEEVWIDCSCCERGYEGSRGQIQSYAPSVSVERIVIDGMEIGKGVERYYYNSTEGSRYVAEPADLFTIESEAQARAEKLAEEYSTKEKEQVRRKEKQTRSWAFNATYHRREISRFEKQIEYHRAKLAAIPEDMLRKAKGG